MRRREDFLSQGFSKRAPFGMLKMSGDCYGCQYAPDDRGGIDGNQRNYRG